MPNKIFKVTIQTFMLAHDTETKWALDPREWNRRVLLEYLLDHPELHIGTTSEVATFASEQPKTETPAAEVVPLFQAAPPAKSHAPYLGKRAHRTRKRSGARGLTQFEYRYFSAKYIKHARQLSIGTHSKSQGKKCVWLTEAEAKCVGAAVTADRRKGKSRHIETNKQAQGGAK